MQSFKSTQFFQKVPEGQERSDPIGRSIQHLSSSKQTTGEATFIDDIPHFENELYAALVVSSRAYAKIVTIDDSHIRTMEGVEGFFTAKDLPGDDKCGVITDDEEILASTEVHCVGAVIGVVVAQNQSLAQRAAKLVKLTYEDLPNPVFTIEQAIESGSMGEPVILEAGDVDEGFQISEFILEGKSYLGGQEHFYLETNVHIAIPQEGEEILMISSAQNVNECQEAVAKALGIASNLVTCKVKRIGGGFGGKESRILLVAVPVALAAAKTGRPVRIMLDREEDMLLTGGRHPFLGRWKVGFTKDGKLNALDINLYCNAGHSFDISIGVLSTAVFSVDNAYKIENMKVTGRCCKTNLPSNTAFRGFGIPQSCFIMEDMISKVSEFLGLHPNKVREKNFYRESGDATPYGQILDNCTIRRCWTEVLSTTNFEAWQERVKDFNRENRFKKRGLSVIPSKFTVAFKVPFLNQGGALVLVYKDGSVLISHGGMEMGQGVHTKMVQVASRALKIPMSRIHIAETSTDKVPNSSPTAASYSTDIYGMAVMNACEEILRRLKPYEEKLPSGGWNDRVNAAYFDRVSLSATGFFKAPGLYPYCPKTRKGSPFSYFTYGVAASEVEIDCLTGDHTVLKTDIVMDIGNSLNPAIDIGQIEGAFMQGYGLFTIEQLVYSNSGSLLTRGPGTYKIPSVHDIPREFNVSLLKGSSNPRAIYSSKAVGEPPLFAGASVFFAIREAVKAARGPNQFQFDSPATAERIRMACEDRITIQIQPLGRKSTPGWSLDL